MCECLVMRTVQDFFLLYLQELILHHCYGINEIRLTAKKNGCGNVKDPEIVGKSLDRILKKIIL